jgi:hypothetical protein
MCADAQGCATLSIDAPHELSIGSGNLRPEIERFVWCPFGYRTICVIFAVKSFP